MVVFGLPKRGGKVYTAIIANAKTETLLPIIQEKVIPESVVYPDALPSDNALQSCPTKGVHLFSRSANGASTRAITNSC